MSATPLRVHLQVAADASPALHRTLAALPPGRARGERLRALAELGLRLEARMFGEVLPLAAVPAPVSAAAAPESEPATRPARKRRASRPRVAQAAPASSAPPPPSPAPAPRPLPEAPAAGVASLADLLAQDDPADIIGGLLGSP